MKTELIEYHRQQARFNTLRASDFESDSPECLRHNARVMFHERAVEWLSGLEAESAMAEKILTRALLNEREPKTYSQP